MPHHVYILRCSDGSYYVGQTTDLNGRVSAHNAGQGSIHTRHRRPVSLVYSEQLPTVEEAVAREEQLKKWSRAKKEALINGDLKLPWSANIGSGRVRGLMTSEIG